MMLNIIASYNELLYAIIDTLYKITTTSRMNFAKTHHFDFQSLLEYRKLWGGGAGVTILSHSAEYFVGYTPCIPILLSLAAVFLFKVIFCEYFGSGI